MTTSKIDVSARFVYPVVKDADDIDLDAEPVAMRIRMKKDGKDGFESTIQIPLGHVSSEEFARAVKSLQLSALSFYHDMYSRLKEEEEERENFPPLLRKDQRGS